MGRMTDRKNDKRRNVGRRLLSCMLAFCLFISAFYGIVFFKIVPKVAQAADEPEIKILVDKTEYSDANPYKLKSKTVILKLDDASASAYQSGDYDVTWDVMTGAENIEIIKYSRTDATINAKKYGEGAVVRVTVEKTSGAFYRVAYCGVDVVFGIDTPVSEFGLINGKRALFLPIGGSKTLTLGLGGSATWSGSDKDVITVNPTSGLVSAIGAGVATVRASGSSEGQEDSIQVYCSPGVTQTEGDVYQSSITCDIDNGGYIYTNTYFNNAPAGVFNDKIYWEVINQAGAVIAKTGAGEAADGSLTVRNATGVFDNRLQVNGLAGKYTMYLYISGTKAAHDEDKSLYTAATVNFTIRSNIKDDKKILGINDKYNLYEAFNITKSDFTKFFGTPAIWMDTNETDPGQYNVPVDAKYATLDKSNYIVTANKEADIVAVMTVSQSTTVREELQKLTGLAKVPDYFVVKLSIADRITLSSDSMEMMKGTEQTLHVNKSSAYNGPITWSSSDNSKVTVEGNGLDGRVTAKEVAAYPGVTITATMDIGNGLYRVAYCQITVIDALSDFDLDHTGKLTLHVGQKEPVFVSVKSDIGTANLPLMWSQSTDKEIIGIDVKDGNNWAVIEGKEGGTTTLMVTNTLDGTIKRLDIEVVIAVESLKFKQDAYTYPFYTSGKLMSTELEVKPNDATASEIAWSVDKESVAKVDQNGYLTFVNPGTVTLTAKVKNDFIGIPVATTTIKVAGGPEEIVFDNLKDDHLDIEVSEQKVVNVKFVPETAETNLKWTTNVSGIVLVEFDTNRRQLTVTGRKAGSCTVTCRTDDNVYYSFTVTVTQGTKSIEFSKESVTLYRGVKGQDTAELAKLLKRTPADSTDSVTYKVKDSKIAKVDEKTGVVTAEAAGQTYVMATTTSGRSNSIDIKVIDQVTGITADKKRLTVYIGETTTVSPTIVPATANEKGIKWTWEPYDEGGTAAISIVEKSGGDVDVTGEAEGLVELTGTSISNKDISISYLVNVTYKDAQYKTLVVLSPKIKYMNVGKYFRVKRSVTDAYNGNKTLKWKSTNKRVATVNKKGRVKSKKVGTTYIVAVCQDGSKAKGRMKVVVRNQVTKISLNKTTANLLVGKTTRLRVIYTPRNATVKGVTWKSSDPAIATVNGGKVIAVATGIVKITATSKDSTGKKASCWVTVSEPQPVTNFTITDAQITVAKGKSVNCGITPNPINATDSIRYFSDNPSVASVNSRGKITTHRVGQASIYARASNGVEGRVDVTVVDLNRKAVTLRQYDTEQLMVNQISEGVTWYSADPNIAKVDENGLVTGRLPGTTIIYANVDGVKLGCRVTVTKIR